MISDTLFGNLRLSHLSWRKVIIKVLETIKIFIFSAQGYISTGFTHAAIDIQKSGKKTSKTP